MRYIKAPILEAALEFRWSSPRSIDALDAALKSSVYDDFEERKPRFQVRASIDIAKEKVVHERERQGFELALRDGSERILLEKERFVFIQSAPYDRWDYFRSRALGCLEPSIEKLEIAEFSRVGLRFVNRIDAPHTSEAGCESDDYITVQFNGPRHDKGVIEEFQMRVVKPTEKDGISYALAVATTPSPLPNHSGILLDIDVFTKRSVPSYGEELLQILNDMREEKNEIFEECITDKTRSLFGGIEE